MGAEIRGRVGVEAGRRRVLPAARQRPDLGDQLQPFPGGQHRDPHHRVVALAAAVVVDRVPGLDQPCRGVVALAQDGLGHARLRAAQGDPQRHLLVDGPQVRGERAARRLGGQQQVQTERRAALGDVRQQPPGLPGQPVLLAEQHLELIHDHQGPGQHLTGRPPVVGQVGHPCLTAQPGPPVDLVVEAPQHAQPELAVGARGDRAGVRQPFGQVGVELDLLEVEQVQLQLLRRVAEGELADQHVQQVGLPHPHVPADQAVVHAADAHDEALRLALAVHADLHVQAVGGDPGPAPRPGDRDPAEAQVPGGRTGRGADRVQPRVGPARRRHLVRLDRAPPEVRVIPGEVPARVQGQVRAQRGQRGQVEAPGHLLAGVQRGQDVQAGPWPVAGQAAEQRRGLVVDAGREPGQDQHVVRNQHSGRRRVVGLHRVVHVGQPPLGDLHHVVGQRRQQGLDLGRPGRHPGTHPQLGGQPQERAQVPALPDRIGEREPDRARPGGGGQPQDQRLQQRPGPVAPVAGAVLADQHVPVPGEPGHRRQPQPSGSPQQADAQAIGRRRVRIRLVTVPRRLVEAAQRPRMRGGQRGHGAGQVTAGPARRPAEVVQVVLVAAARRGGRPGQADVGVVDLALDRPDRHLHLCCQPAHPYGQPNAGDRQPPGNSRQLPAPAAPRVIPAAPRDPVTISGSAHSPTRGPETAQARRRSVAHRVSWCREDSCSLRSTDDTCDSTVLTEMYSSRAISLYV